MKIIKPKMPDKLSVAEKFAEALKIYDKDGIDIAGFSFVKEEEAKLNVESVEIQESAFSDCVLIDCVFDKVIFVNAIFENCDISNTRFEGCGFHNVEFKNCKLMGTVFSENTFNHVLVKDCLCRYMNASFSKIKNTAFIKNDMTGADMNGCLLKPAQFTDCDMTEIELSDVILKDVDLRSNNISGIKLKGYELKGAVVNAFQAMELSKLLGILIKD